MFELFDEGNSSESLPPDRKRKLGLYGTLEEELQKVEARRMQNRVAARSLRSRKKAKMEGLENDIQLLMDEKQSLASECVSLKDLNEKLSEENVELRNKLANNTTVDYALPTISKSVQKEQTKCAALSSDTLLELWRQASAVQIPECRCTNLS